MFNFLFAIKHLPAMDTQNFSVRFCFNDVEFMDESIPFGRISFNHLLCVFISRFHLLLGLVYTLILLLLFLLVFYLIFLIWQFYLRLVLLLSVSFFLFLDLTVFNLIYLIFLWFRCVGCNLLVCWFELILLMIICWNFVT